MSMKRIINGFGEVRCSVCGEFKPTDCFYEGKNQCKNCYNSKSNKYHKEDLNSRARLAMSNQKERVGYLTNEDIFTGDDLKWLLTKQNNRCAASGIEFTSLEDFEICHIVSVENGGHCNLDNLQLLLPKYNARGKAGTKNVMYITGCIKIEFDVKIDFNGRDKNSE
jgi:5-methylcytosine-specific restriction endonuclease McrA